MYKKQAKHEKKRVKKQKNKYIYIVILLFLASATIPISFSKYASKISKTIMLNIRKPNYTVRYNYMLPDEYQEVEYIESTGTQYIDTGVILTNNLKTEVVYSENNTSSINFILGANDSKTYYGLSGNENQTISSYFNSQETTIALAVRENGKKYYGLLDIEYDETNGYRMYSKLEDLSSNTVYEQYSDYNARNNRKCTKCTYIWIKQ